MEHKITWKVAEEPSGRYRSFFQRGWPHAYYDGVDGRPAAYIACDDSYTAKRARGEQPHGELTVFVAQWITRPNGDLAFNWKRCKKRCATLAEAKYLAAHIIEKYDFAPHTK